MFSYLRSGLRPVGPVWQGASWLIALGVLAPIASLAWLALGADFSHWQDLLRLENSALRLGNGHLDERVNFDSASSLTRVGVAFNQMADNISTLIASKKQLIDGIAHAGSVHHPGPATPNQPSTVLTTPVEGLSSQRQMTATTTGAIIIGTKISPR